MMAGERTHDRPALGTIVGLDIHTIGGSEHAEGPVVGYTKRGRPIVDLSASGYGQVVA